MKLIQTEKVFILIIFTLVFIFTCVYLWQNPKIFLTSQTYYVSHEKTQTTSIEKSVTVIINSPDFNSQMGLTKPVVIAADKASNVIELKTSAKNKDQSIANFQKYEPLILNQLKSINQQFNLIPTSLSPVTQEVQINYLKIIGTSLISAAILSFFVIISGKYIR